MKKSVWDKLANKYDNLWVQKHSLGPSRNMVIKYMEKYFPKELIFCMLDVGCATGELLCNVGELYPRARLFGLDKSREMLKIANEKNPNIRLANCYASQYKTMEKFDIISCCHSFPYYDNKKEVLEVMSRIISPKGKLIFIQASKNSFYDKLVMFFVEFTAEKADYLSKKDFIQLTQPYFDTEDVFLIKQRLFMPSIYGFVLKPKEAREDS